MTSFFKNVYPRINNALDYFIDYIFPREELEIKAHNLNMEDIAALPRPHQLKKSHTFALFDYKNPLVREIIWQIKFYENDHVARIVAKPFSTLIQENCQNQEYIIIPIPISKERLKERGFNQTELITKHLYSYMLDVSYTYKPDTLRKIKETKHQTGEPRKERLTNLKNSFKIVDKKVIHNKNIIVIDDVTTTGATFTEVTQTLKAAGAKEVFCFSLAH